MKGPPKTKNNSTANAVKTQYLSYTIKTYPSEIEKSALMHLLGLSEMNFTSTLCLLQVVAQPSFTLIEK